MKQENKEDRLRDQLWKVRKSDKLFTYPELARQIKISMTAIYGFMNHYPAKASFTTTYRVEQFLKRSKFKDILK